MKAALVKIDVAAVLLDKTVREVWEMAAWGGLQAGGLKWVFNLACDPLRGRREIRFWKKELLEWPRARRRTIETVTAQILADNRAWFHGAEVDQLLQIRPRTRIDFAQALPGRRSKRTHHYRREVLLNFLRHRWVGRKLTEVTA